MTPYFSRSYCDIYHGSCLDILPTLPERRFHCCVTSPPYFGLRKYGDDAEEIGSEATPDEFVAAMVAVFRQVWRVLRDDGVLWLNLGDSYNAYNHNRGPSAGFSDGTNGRQHPPHDKGLTCPGLKPKDLIGIPWRVAFALQADGWYLRDAVVWHKPAPMPGSQRDRCTSSYEFVFQLTKRPRYFFDLEAVKEPCKEPGDYGFLRGPLEARGDVQWRAGSQLKRKLAGVDSKTAGGATRTPRNVWRIAHDGFNGGHFATMPIELAARCIKASTSVKGCCAECGAPIERIVERKRKPTRPGRDNCSDETGKANRDEQRHVTETRTTGWRPTCDCNAETEPCRVLDPFGGVATTVLAARGLGRHATICELYEHYCEMAAERLAAANDGRSRIESLDGQMELFT